VDRVFEKIKSKFMANNVLYFKVAANLNLDEYNEEVFDEMLSNIYSFLSRDIK
jgi:hypothetical protein